MQNLKELANLLTIEFLNHRVPKNLKKIGVGSTRTVYKIKYRNFVVKYNYSAWSNKSEYALYNALAQYQIGSNLAKCYEISDCGRVLIQEYIPGEVSLDKLSDENLSKSWKSLDALACHFDFIGKFDKSNTKPLCDLHTDNLKVVKNSSRIKIIDYATILEHMIPYYEYNDLVIRLAKFYPKYKTDFELYLDSERAIILSQEPSFYLYDY